MAKHSPDERLVYLAFKNVFKGNDAQLRKSKRISELIEKHQKNPDIKSLIKRHGVDNIRVTVKALLEENIFESTLQAKLRFPDIFEVTPGQSAKREASEAKAAKTEANAMKEAAQGGDMRPLETGGAGKVDTDGQVEGDECPGSSLVSDGEQSHPKSALVPSLYPAYLPYSSQHQVLLRLQTILENACYSFGKQRLPDILMSSGWDCPGSVELNLFAKVLLANTDLFDGKQIKASGRSLAGLLNSIINLRHTAVHRLRVTINTVETFLDDAEALVSLFEDPRCEEQLSYLRRQVHTILGELKSNKDLLESRLAEKLKDIAVQREELDKLEQSGISAMLREDVQYQNIASKNVIELLANLDSDMRFDNPLEGVTAESEEDETQDLDVDDASLWPVVEGTRVQSAQGYMWRIASLISSHKFSKALGI
ncbi:hypothetical protein MBLNU459_g0593t1 [Dothideomycetes sp. NU459]